jgi:hypothetical protein
MDDVDMLLSEKFLEFSQTIAKLYVEKKKKKESLKKIYEQFQAELKAIDEAAEKAHQEFENWKKGQDDDGHAHFCDCET